MKNYVRISIALMGVVCLFAFSSARADEFSDRIARSIATLNEIDKLIDSIQARQHSATDSASAAAAETMKCGACGMEMSTKNTNPNFRAVKINGKTFYCCKGCDMSKIIDK